LDFKNFIITTLIAKLEPWLRMTNTKVMLQQILPLINEVKLLKVQKPKGMFWSKHPIQETLVFFYTLYGCLVG
jgi:hypothetical protein